MFKVIRDIKRKTRRKHNTEGEIRIVIEEMIAELCRREGLVLQLNKEFMEADKTRLSGNATRQAFSSEVDDLRQEKEQFKQAAAEPLMQNQATLRSLRYTCVCDSTKHEKE